MIRKTIRGIPRGLHPRRSRPPWPALALCFAVFSLATILPLPAHAQPADSHSAAAERTIATPAIAPDDLLREALAKEEPAADGPYMAWMDRLEKPRGSVTKLMVSTPQGILSRTVAIDDRPLSADERQQDDERIDRLLDPAKMQEKAKKQHEDQQRVERLMRALPDGFLCDYAAAPAQERTLLLECSPRPDFSPPNFESQILLGMKAEIAIDRDERRIVRLAGTLFRDVSFGWGLLAKLNSGGRIEIDQSRAAGKQWGITHMQLNFDGHLVVVKPLHIQETESCWNYRPVPAMTVPEALEFLRKAPAPIAH